MASAEAGIDFPAGEPHQTFAERFDQAYRSEMAAFVELILGRAGEPLHARRTPWRLPAWLTPPRNHWPRVSPVKVALKRSQLSVSLPRKMPLRNRVPEGHFFGALARPV